jgi:hypothetical protein
LREQRTTLASDRPDAPHDGRNQNVGPDRRADECPTIGICSGEIEQPGGEVAEANGVGMRRSNRGPELLVGRPGVGSLSRPGRACC